MIRVSPKDLVIPIAILLAGILLAGTIYVLRIRHNLVYGTGTTVAVAPVTPTDHIIGNPTAPIVIVEYADIESSYTKSFQLTMEQLMTEYADGGKVAWVFRHFPLTTVHENAATHALAAECVSSLSLPTTFFRFIDAIHAAAPGENVFNPSQYPLLLSQFGISKADFEACMTNAGFSEKVHKDYANALAAGATGSPFVVLLIEGQEPLPITGALPYAAMKKVIEDAISKLPS